MSNVVYISDFRLRRKIEENLPKNFRDIGSFLNWVENAKSGDVPIDYIFRIHNMNTRVSIPEEKLIETVFGKSFFSLYFRANYLKMARELRDKSERGNIL